MPDKDGLRTLREIIIDYPDLPVIMVSALDNRDTLMQALEIGAFEFIPKPSGSISLNIDDIINELQEKIKVSIKAKNKQVKNKIPAQIDTPRYTPAKNNSYSLESFPIIAIGSSSGGPKALKDIITTLPRDPGSHRYRSAYASWLYHFSSKPPDPTITPEGKGSRSRECFNPRSGFNCSRELSSNL